MFNYLKKSLFSVLILMMPYMNSVSKAMDDGDYEGASVRVHKVSFAIEDQKDVSSSLKQSISSQVKSLEDPQNSWMSYLMFPVKNVVQNAYDILDYTTCNPQKAMIIGVVMAYQVTSVAAMCYCTCVADRNNQNCVYAGMENSNATCYRTCSDNFMKNSICIY